MISGAKMNSGVSRRPSGGGRRLANGQSSELVTISRDGSDAQVIYHTNELIEAPNWTPDGQWLIYNADGRLFRISPDGTIGPQRINSAPAEDLNNDHLLSPDGSLIYVSSGDGHLYVLPIGGGVPKRLSNDQDRARGYKYYLHGISPDGETLAYVGLEREKGRTVTRICTIPAQGGADLVLTDGGCPVDGPEFSPDGRWMYFNAETAATVPGHAQCFRMRPDGSGLEQLTHDERVNWFPHPAPDGSIHSFISFPPGTLGHPADRPVILRTMAPDGSGIRDLDAFNGGQGSINVNSWAPDSQRLAYVRYPVAG